MAELRFPVEIDDSQASKELNKLVSKIDKLKQSIAKTEAARAPIVEQLKDAQNAAVEAYNKVEQLKAALAASEQRTSITGTTDPLTYTNELERQEQIRNELAEQEAIMRTQEREAQRLEAADQRILSTLETQTAELQNAQDRAGELTRTISETSDAQRLRTVFEGVTRSINGGVKSLLKWGFGIRSLYILVRRLRQYIVEAVKSYAEHDPETKANINELKNALAGLKASWGAAFAPVLNAVVPILKTLISWLTAAANAIAAFFAALSGKGSYKKAVASTGELSSNLGGAADNAKEAKKELMGIDELNVMSSSDTSGSGGGGGAGGGLEYEDVAISEGLLQNLELIKDLVIGIAAGLAGWKIASMFTKDLKKLIGAFLFAAGLAVQVKNTIDQIVNGIDWESFKENLISSAAAIGGAFLLFGETGGAITMLVIGIKDVILALHEWAETGELTDAACATMIKGILEIGAAIALLTGSWIPLAVAAVAAVVLAIYNYWDEIKAWFTGVWNDVLENQREVGERMKEDWNEIKTSLANVWNSIKATAISIWDSIKTTVTSKVDTLKNSIVEKFNALKASLSNIVENIKSLFHFEFHMPTLRLPHIQVTWQDAGALAQFFGISQLPHLSVAWYAKGGIVDGATLIGAGEQGKEAIVPLERNTQWVNMVARELADMLFDRDIFTEIADRISNIPTALDRMTAQLANIGNIPMPAVAMGTVVPPNATSGGYAYSALESKIDALLDRLGGLSGGGGKIEPSDIYLDKRKVGEVVYDYIEERNRGRGK